ncbi:hypothetical protein Q9R08_05185 [Microbacterium sp. QXD-8]|uniref:Uncharacterized protein n=1 Tax=Microbacterium psychrotolerans TaxID=3068321 RepID=A0ABU0YYE9_9MICO|nr:hypothetical protein [Microbacterium sp. QXD-8]MDQ7877367.1 hypothetical protein [Microbacterium sp. QXD-8]
MAWPTVVPSDVANLWRPLTTAEVTVATARIALVEAELRSELRLYGITGTLLASDFVRLGFTSEEAEAAAAEWPTLYKGIVADVVRQSLINPEGWLEERESIDDFERTRRRDQATSTGLAFLDADDVAKLIPRRRRKRGAFSIHLGQT